MEKTIRLPQKNEILGIGLIRYSGMAGPMLYFCFDGELRYVRRAYGFRHAITPVFENELVLINKQDDTLIHKYSVEEIKILAEKMLLMDLPSIIGLAQSKRETMFNKKQLEESAKTRIDIMGIFLNSRLGFDVFISRIGKNERIPAKILMDNFLSMYEDLSGKYMYLESMFANEKTSLENDYFATLLELDEKLNKKGYRIICNGTSRDVWPIGNQRDFYKGLIGCRWLKDGQEVINIFEVSDWIKYCTTKEHTGIFHKKFKISSEIGKRVLNREIRIVLDILRGFFEKNKFKFNKDKFSEAVKLMKVIYDALPDNNQFDAGSMTEEIHARFSAVFKLIKEENIKLKNIDELWQILEDAFLFMEKLEIIKEAVGHGYGPDSTKRAFTCLCYLFGLLKSREDEEDFRQKFNKIQHTIVSLNKKKAGFILLQVVRWVK